MIDNFMANVIITKNNYRLWGVLFVAAGTIILQKYVPKFVKWYDRKVDKLIEKDYN